MLPINYLYIQVIKFLSAKSRNKMQIHFYKITSLVCCRTCMVLRLESSRFWLRCSTSMTSFSRASRCSACLNISFSFTKFSIRTCRAEQREGKKCGDTYLMCLHVHSSKYELKNYYYSVPQFHFRAVVPKLLLQGPFLRQNYFQTFSSPLPFRLFSGWLCFSNLIQQ